MHLNIEHADGELAILSDAVLIFSHSLPILSHCQVSARVQRKGEFVGWFVLVAESAIMLVLCGLHIRPDARNRRGAFFFQL